MNFLNGIQNFLHLIDANWTTILVICGLGVSIGKKAKDYFAKSDEEKITLAKFQIQQSMLKMITDTELDYDSLAQAGSVKRSQVIQQIYEKYPILSKAIDQSALVEWIDVEINNSLKTLQKIVTENK